MVSEFDQFGMSAQAQLDQGVERSWTLAGYLPNPPIVGDDKTQDTAINSMHVLARDQILIHYENGHAV